MITLTSDARGVMRHRGVTRWEAGAAFQVCEAFFPTHSNYFLVGMRC
jgi:hypothetical protein